MKLIHSCLLCALLLPFGLAAQKAHKSTDIRIVLPNVQFAAEKSTIRLDAARELNEVVALLEQSRSATVEIGAHTDADGSTSYNLRLSQQRAQAVAAYLIKNGIASKRLKAKGYGETQPLNRCRRGVRCSEAEKRQNRRVELHVLGLPADSVVQARWLELGGIRPARQSALTAKMPPPEVPTVPRTPVSTGTPPAVPVAQVSGISGDYFPELKAGSPAPAPVQTASAVMKVDNSPRTLGDPATAGQHVPQPLPGTFVGYTIEIACTDKPLAAGHPVLRRLEPVLLRQEAGGPYCYYVGVFHTLPEAQAFLHDKALPLFAKARVVAIANNEKKYFSN